MIDVSETYCFRWAISEDTLDVVSEYKGFPRIFYSLKLHVRMCLNLPETFAKTPFYKSKS